MCLSTLTAARRGKRRAASSYGAAYSETASGLRQICPRHPYLRHVVRGPNADRSQAVLGSLSRDGLAVKALPKRSYHVSAAIIHMCIRRAAAPLDMNRRIRDTTNTTCRFCSQNRTLLLQSKEWRKKRRAPQPHDGERHRSQPTQGRRAPPDAAVLCEAAQDRVFAFSELVRQDAKNGTCTDG